MSEPLLQVDNLHVDFQTYGGIVQAVRGVSFDVQGGQTLAIVGESGCGKSVTVQSLMGLIPMPPGRIHQGSATLRGKDILASKFIDGDDIRGREISMIFQDPMTSLNPTMNIGSQIAETLEVHRGYSKTQAFNRAIELLDMSKIPEAAKRAKQYPFEFSGGMLQRAMIAMAIACEPAILIADEPTTALDVTIQLQYLNLLKDLQRSTGMGMLFITHDFGVVAHMCDRVAVMYAGRIVETGPVREVFDNPVHPYTQALIASVPKMAYQPPKCLCRYGIVELIEGIGRIRSHVSIVLALSHSSAIGHSHGQFRPQARSSRPQGQDSRHRWSCQPLARNARQAVQGRGRCVSRQHEPWRTCRSCKDDRSHSRDGKAVHAPDRDPR